MGGRHLVTSVELHPPAALEVQNGYQVVVPLEFSEEVLRRTWGGLQVEKWPSLGASGSQSVQHCLYIVVDTPRTCFVAIEAKTNKIKKMLSSSCYIL